MTDLPNPNDLNFLATNNIHGDITISQELGDPDAGGSVIYNALFDWQTRPNLITALFLYDLQTGRDVPYEKDWHQRLFGGNELPKIRMEDDVYTLRDLSQPRYRFTDNRGLALRGEAFGFELPEKTSGEDLYPIIDQNAYLRFSDERGVAQLHLTPGNISVLEQTLITSLAGNDRGQAGALAEIYQEFPFQEYREFFEV